ncbi:hypothetical protein CVT24_000581 [Panaeolus cyanescens]|uniref:Uncharacterized protein n=1 Tax=Panaeolus cyanescens TaxID=181874 RepID=A0A409XBQ1_9AGAR|nr:hypothetical protein CVT24_000581 [Panaeolus cyanescens]
MLGDLATGTAQCAQGATIRQEADSASRCLPSPSYRSHSSLSSTALVSSSIPSSGIQLKKLLCSTPLVQLPRRWSSSFPSSEGAASLPLSSLANYGRHVMQY